MNEFITASARGLFDYDLNDRTRTNGAKLIVKYFNTSVAQHIYPIKITTTWNALPIEVVSSRTVNSFKNSLDKHWAENPQISELTGNNHRCRAQFKCVQTVVGQHFSLNGPTVCSTTTNTTTTTTNSCSRPQLVTYNGAIDIIDIIDWRLSLPFTRGSTKENECVE